MNAIPKRDGQRKQASKEAEQLSPDQYANYLKPTDIFDEGGDASGARTLTERFLKWVTVALPALVIDFDILISLVDDPEGLKKAKEYAKACALGERLRSIRRSRTNFVIEQGECDLSQFEALKSRELSTISGTKPRVTRWEKREGPVFSLSLIHI